MKKLGIVAVLALVGVVAAGCAGSKDSSARRAAIGSSAPVAGSGSIAAASLANGAPIRVDSWSFRISNTVSFTSGAGGTGMQAGKSNPGEFQVVKNIDNASTALFLAVNKGTMMPTLTFRVGTVLTYTFSNVVVVSVEQSGDGSDGHEQVSFKYSKLQTDNVASGSLTRATFDWATLTGG